MGTGFIPTPVGPGFQTNRSAGQLTITGVGRGFVLSAGFGCRATNGPRPGFRGAKAAIMLVGHRCPQKPVSIAGAAFTIGPTIITTLDPINMSSSLRDNSGKSESNAQSCPSNATSPSLIRRPTSRTSLTITRSSLTRDPVTRNCEHKLRRRSDACAWSGSPV